MNTDCGCRNGESKKVKEIVRLLHDLLRQIPFMTEKTLLFLGRRTRQNAFEKIIYFLH